MRCSPTLLYCQIYERVLYCLDLKMAILGFKLAPWMPLLFSLASGSLHTNPSRAIDSNHFDYVILGGGTAGLVVASRLSEDPNVTVAVIEAGDFERNNPNVTSIVSLGLAKDTRVDWQYESTPQTFAANQTLIWSAGKGLGGSSLINGMSSALFT